MVVGVVQETFPGERRVALTPIAVPPLLKAGWKVLIEAGAGASAGFSDLQFQEKGAQIAPSREAVFAAADVIVQVRALGANLSAGLTDLERLRSGQTVVGFAEPIIAAEAVQQFAARRVSLFALELMPRTTRAQMMDVLSSMATIAGYKAVILAAGAMPKIFPMLTTAAGTVAPARILVIGAGVAGLQAIATARRLGAIVEAYDVRSAVKEQVESLGARFVDLPLEAGSAEDKGGYAKQLGEETYRRQRELMLKVVAGKNAVICTAAIPGKQAPVLISTAMVEAMQPGSVIVDLAAERGGNCELTQAGKTIEHHGVSILGPINLPATAPYDASLMYARNVTAFLLHVGKSGKLEFDLTDEIVQGTLAAHEGEVVHPAVRAALGLPPRESPP